MATTKREGGTGEKVKKGPTPSAHRTTTARNTNSSSTTTTVSPSSSRRQSPKPNRPRPTSRTTTPTRTNDSSTAVRVPKKPSSLPDQTPTTTAKPAVPRRKSLDRPNPPSVSASAHPSPNNNKPKTMRSVYLSPKFSSTFSPKSAAAAEAKKAATTGKSSLTCSRSMKKSNSTSASGATASTAKKTAFVPKKTPTPTPASNVEDDDTKNVINVETTTEDHESPVHDVKEVVEVVDNDHHVDGSETPKDSDIEHELDVVSDQLDELDHHNAITDELDEDILHGEKLSDPVEPEAEATIEEQNVANADPIQHEEVVEAEPENEEENKEIANNEAAADVVVDDEEENQSTQKMETTENTAADELELEESKGEKSVTVTEDPETAVVVEESVDDNNNNIRKREVVMEPKVVEGVNNNGNPNMAAKLQSSGVQGKESPKPSNDVIEETASKLLERKNKVRALAGAFQTVIDYQVTPSPKSSAQ